MIAAAPNVIIQPDAPVAIEDEIVGYYRKATPKKLLPLRPHSGDALTSVCQGLGDTMMLTDIAATAGKLGARQVVFSPSPHFLQLMSFNPYYKDYGVKGYLMNAPDLVRCYESGNGHYLQRLRRVCHFPVEDKPHGFLRCRGLRNSKRVVMHFDPGIHVRWQRKTLHRRARMIYPETQQAIKEFVASHPEMDFIEIGNNPLKIEGTHYVQCKDTIALVNAMHTAEWFIGIMSGPMHVASALGLKCVVIINFPVAHKIFLPTLVTTGQVEEEWFYPQHVHLHQDSEGPLVKRATAYNLQRAFNGELYPFWSDKYLSLIHQKL